MHTMLLLSLFLLALSTTGAAVLLFCRMRTYRRALNKMLSEIMATHGYSGEDIRKTRPKDHPDKQILFKTEGEERFKNLVFKVGLVVRSGKTGLWDYHVQTDTFSYPVGHSSYFEKFTWRQYLQHVHPDDRSIPDDAMREVLQGRSDSMQICCRLRIPGEEVYRWFDIVAVVYERDEKGRPVLISGLRWDISDSVRERQQLENSKALLELTFKASNLIPWEVDWTTRKLCPGGENPLFRHKDYTVNQYIGQFVHPDFRQALTEQVDGMAARRQSTVDMTVRAEYNGRYEWVSIVGRNIEDPRNRSFKAVGTVKFITDEVEQRQELVALRRKAESADRMKSAFLANMSHEIRTPLNAIVGFSNLIPQTDDPAEAKEFCRLIETNNELLLRLINDILDISKIEAGQLEFSYGETDIREVFSEIGQTYSYRMPDGVRLVCELPDADCVIRTDKSRFVQVVSNFLNNAVKYTSQGSITMGYARFGGGFRFYVRDTGKGISPENVPNVFERFTKFDSFVSGTGLGLSICETIVRRFGGEIGVDSEPGKGSEFWFTIPDGK